MGVAQSRKTRKKYCEVILRNGCVAGGPVVHVTDPSATSAGDRAAVAVLNPILLNRTIWSEQSKWDTASSGYDGLKEIRICNESPKLLPHIDPTSTLHHSQEFEVAEKALTNNHRPTPSKETSPPFSLNHKPFLPPPPFNNGKAHFPNPQNQQILRTSVPDANSLFPNLRIAKKPHGLFGLVTGTQLRCQYTTQSSLGALQWRMIFGL